MIRIEPMPSASPPWTGPEGRRPATPPLWWTRNFMWVVVLCMLSLQIVPVIIAWAASVLLK